MANIINIDTSTKFCSVAVSIDGEIVYGLESREEMDHSTTLAPFVEKAMKYLRDKGLKAEAVSVAIGPGSYTGLRIGLSLAKGLCYSEDIPLITLSSLEIMAVRAMFTFEGGDGEELLCPMLDAGRMEVYTAVYNLGLKPLLEDTPMILDENSLKDIVGHRKVVFIGNGIEKFKAVSGIENSVWLGSGLPHAKYMSTLSELRFRKGVFADLAYVTPRYLKDYQATVKKNRI